MSLELLFDVANSRISTLILQHRELLDNLHLALSWKLSANSILIMQRSGVRDKSHMVSQDKLNSISENS